MGGVVRLPATAALVAVPVPAVLVAVFIKAAVPDFFVPAMVSSVVFFVISRVRQTVRVVARLSVSSCAPVISVVAVLVIRV